MTEEEWLVCVEPESMLKSLTAPTERKLRLFALACCGRVNHLITDSRSRAAIEFGTKYIETSISRQRGRATRAKAGHAAWKDLYGETFKFIDERSSSCMARSCAASAAVQLVATDPMLAACHASSFACFAGAWMEMSAAGISSRNSNLSSELKAPEFAQQACLLRDIFGNPFRPVALDPAWLTSTVVALANGIYDDRAFDRMPILADALQDAGCTNDDVLDHCRDANQVHVRGCRVVDLLLGKK